MKCKIHDLPLSSSEIATPFSLCVARTKVNPILQNISFLKTFLLEILFIFVFNVIHALKHIKPFNKDVISK